MSNLKLPSFLLINLFIAVACSQNTSDPTTEFSETESFDYDTIHGQWVISEVHWLDVEGSLTPSMLEVKTDLNIAQLNFYRPTLGDPARLEIFWHCDGLGFSFDYTNGTLVRSTDIGGVNGPWPIPSNLTSSKMLRTSCTSIPLNQQQQVGEVGAGLHRLANRLTLFESYQLEIFEDNVVSLFTEQGDGVYATRQ